MDLCTFKFIETCLMAHYILPVLVKTRRTLVKNGVLWLLIAMFLSFQLGQVNNSVQIFYGFAIFFLLTFICC